MIDAAVILLTASELMLPTIRHPAPVEDVDEEVAAVDEDDVGSGAATVTSFPEVDAVIVVTPAVVVLAALTSVVSIAQSSSS